MRLLRKNNNFIRDEGGNIHAPRQPRGWNDNYLQAVERYLTLWDELFDKAQEADEFQFILALIRMKGVESAGWDTFENTIGALKGAAKASERARGEDKLNLMLWLYGHAVEASDHYEIIANMVNIAGGGPYRAWNFPRKNTRTGQREQTPNEKILEIKDRCQKLGLKDYSAPFAEVLDKELRNAVYHSDYSTYQGRVRFRDSKTGFAVEYDIDKTNRIINQAMAMHETIRNLSDSYRRSYTEPEIIEAGANFSPNLPMKAQLIIRKRHGVIAMREHPHGPGSFMLGRFVPGEMEKIEKGIFLLPRSSRDALNNALDYVPSPIARQVVKLYKYLHRNHYQA